VSRRECAGTLVNVVSFFRPTLLFQCHGRRCTPNQIAFLVCEPKIHLTRLVPSMLAPHERFELGNIRRSLAVRVHRRMCVVTVRTAYRRAHCHGSQHKTDTALHFGRHFQIASKKCIFVARSPVCRKHSVKIRPTKNNSWHNKERDGQDVCSQS
jgi:hypothetical protein